MRECTPFHSAVLTPRLLEEFQQRNRREREEPPRRLSGKSRLARGPVEDYSWYRLATSEVEHWGRQRAHSVPHFGRLGDPFMCFHVGLRVVGRAPATLVYTSIPI